MPQRAVGQHVYSEIESEKLVGILSRPSLILRGTMAIEPEIQRTHKNHNCRQHEWRYNISNNKYYLYFIIYFILNLQKLISCRLKITAFQNEKRNIEQNLHPGCN